MDDYLKHYGVVGMKWGVRKSRPSSSSGSKSSVKSNAKKSVKKVASAAQIKLEANKKKKSELKTYNKLRKKKVSKLTDEELDIMNRRYDSESRYLNSKSASAAYNSGKREIQKIISDSAKQTIKPALVKSGTYAVNRLIKSTSGINEPMDWGNFADFVAPVKEKKKD